MEDQGDMFGQLLSTARSNLFIEARIKSTHCPCCRHHVKIYKRKLNSGMAKTLIYTYRFFKDRPYAYLDVAHYMLKQIPNWVPSDYGKLVWWGLLEKCEDPPEKGKKSSGKYRMTHKGRMFTERRIKVPAHAIEFLSEVESFSETEVDIVQALGKHFNYYELMRSPGVF